MSSTKSVDTKTAILDAARELFEAEGYVAVGLEAVAKKAGVSRQAIYLHFDSKAALLEALHLRINELDVAPAMDKVWVAPDALTALDVFVAGTTVAIGKIIRIFIALDTARRFAPEAQETWRSPATGRYAECLRLTTWLQRDGVLARGVSARDGADIVWSITNVRCYESLVVDRGWSPRRWSNWVRATLHAQLLSAAI